MKKAIISKPVLYLSLASLFADIASETIYPLLPLFLTTVLGASTVWLGTIEGIAESISSLTKMYAGVLSDRLGKQKIFVILGYGLSTLRFLIGFATQAPHVLGIRVVDRIGKGIRTSPRDAWLSKNASPETRGQVFGFHRGMDNLGATIAPLLAAAFLYFFPGSIRTLFALTLLPGLVAIYFVFLAIKTSPPEIQTALHSSDKIEWKKVFQMPRSFYLYLSAFFLFGLAMSADSFLILKFHAVGLPLPFVPLLWAALNAVKTGASFWGGRFSDQFGARKALCMGWVFYGVCYALFASSQSLFLLLIVFFIYGFAFGLIEAPEKSIVAQLAPSHLKGSAFGLFHLVTGIAFLPANVIVGILWTSLGSKIALGFSAAMSAIAFLVLIFISKTIKDPLSSRS